MICINEVTGLVGVEAYGGIWPVALLVRVFAFAAVCIGDIRTYLTSLKNLI